MKEPSAGSGILSLLAPLAFVAGLALVSFTLLMLSVGAGMAGVQHVEEYHITTNNGTATLAYPVANDLRHDSRLEGEYRFPQAPGTAMVIGCGDYAAVMAGGAPSAPAEWLVGAREGRFSLRTPQLHFGPASFLPPNPGDPAPLRFYCGNYFVAFQWTVDPAEADPLANRPDVDLVVRTLPLDGEATAPFTIFGTAGTLLALLGGVGWARRINARRRVPPADEDESAAETLLRVLERTGEWLERTRRSLLMAGVLGIFLWYPVLVPWAWAVGAKSSARPWMPWFLSGAVVVLLLLLSAFWAREYLRLDKELAAWRERMARLREREARLLSDAPGPDG